MSLVDSDVRKSSMPWTWSAGIGTLDVKFALIEPKLESGEVDGTHRSSARTTCHDPHLGSIPSLEN